MGMIGLVGVIVKMDRIKGNRHAAGSAHHHIQRIVARYFKAQHPLFPFMQIERSSISMCNAHCRDQNGFKQTVEIALLGQGDADLIEIFECDAEGCRKNAWDSRSSLFVGHYSFVSLGWIY